MNRRRMRHTNELRPNIAQFHEFVNMERGISTKTPQNFAPSSLSRNASKVGYVVAFIPKHAFIIAYLRRFVGENLKKIWRATQKVTRLFTS